MGEIHKQLADIQKKLKAPKSQYNSFGKYKYRNCEDILEAVKPLLGDATLTLTDEIVQIGERYYVKATACYHIGDPDDMIFTTAYAREAQTKKGMDESQITASTSSFARKIALNGLFCIDDTKDADSQDNASEAKTAPKQRQATHETPTVPFDPPAAPDLNGADPKATQNVTDEESTWMMSFANAHGVDSRLAQAIKKVGANSPKDFTRAQYTAMVKDLQQNIKY